VAKLKLPLTDTRVVLLWLFCKTSSLPRLRPMTVPATVLSWSSIELELSAQAVKNVSDAKATEILKAFILIFQGD